MKDFFTQAKEEIHAYLIKIGDLLMKDSIIKTCSGEDLIKGLVDFSSRGKMVRGGLVSYSYRLFTQRDRHPQSIALGALLELLQSALLIHDDIMDQDELRRGKETLHFQYQKEGLAKGIHDARHRGVSLAICGGDVSLFWAIDLLSQLDFDKKTHGQLLERISREMVYVGLAQMEDVRNGYRKENVTEEGILNLYRFKTGRYTFSLPLMLGAILAGQGKEVQETLAHWGELLGILFQIKDDQLGLLGDQVVLGKPLGSDIREGKQTLYYRYLMDALDEKEKFQIRKLFGNPRATEDEIHQVYHQIKTRNIHGRVQKKVEEIHGELLGSMDEASWITQEIKTGILALHQYNQSREN